MKSLRIFLALCLFVSQAHAGTLQLLGAGKPAAAGGGCSQATTFLAAAAGTTHSAAYTTLICNLVSQGVFAKLDGLYIFATDTHTIADINLIQPGTFNLTENGPPTFTASQGFTGSQAGGGPHLDTGFTPGTSTGNYARDSASLGIWTRTSNFSSGGNYSGMLGGAGPDVEANVSNNDFGSGVVSSGLNQAFGSSEAAGTGSGVGFAVGNRSASNAIQVYYNGSSAGTNTTASVVLTNAVPLWFLTRNFNSGSNQSSDEQMSAAVFGGSLSGTDQANLCHEVGAYLFTVGAVGSNPC